MTAVLVANVAATFFMVGLTWFVQMVHYPLFPSVGASDFPGYHEIHSNRTTWVRTLMWTGHGVVLCLLLLAILPANL